MPCTHKLLIDLFSKIFFLYELLTRIAVQHVLLLRTAEALLLGLTVNNTEGLTPDHSGYRGWSVPCSLYARDMFFICR